MVKQVPLETEEFFRQTEKLLKQAKTLHQFEQTIVTAPFADPRMGAYLGLGLIGFLRVNEKEELIERVSFTKNEISKGISRMSHRPLEKITIPLNYANNFIAKAVRENHYMITADWQYLFNPALTAEQSHFAQAGGGIACSVIYPLSKIRCAMVFSYYETIQRIGNEHHLFMARYSSLVQRVYAEIADKK